MDTLMPRQGPALSADPWSYVFLTIVQYHNLAMVKSQQDSVVELRLSTTVAAARVTTCSGLKRSAITVESNAIVAIPVATTVSAAANLNALQVSLLRSEFGAAKARTKAQGANTIEIAKLSMALIKNPKVLKASQRGFSIGRIAKVAISLMERIGWK